MPNHVLFFELEARWPHSSNLWPDPQVEREDLAEGPARAWLLGPALGEQVVVARRDRLEGRPHAPHRAARRHPTPAAVEGSQTLRSANARSFI